MEKRKPGIAGVPDPQTGFILVALGTARHPDVQSIVDKRYKDGVSVVVRCGCDQNTDPGYTRLADGHLKFCQYCGAVIGRCGRKIVAGNWDTESKIIPVMPNR